MQENSNKSKQVVKSCQDRLEHTLSDDQFENQSNLKYSKSWKSQRQQKEEWEQKDQFQKQMYRKAVNQQLKKQNKKKFSSEQSQLPRFTSQLQKSQQVSIDQQQNGSSFRSQSKKDKRKNMVEQNMKQERQKITLNIILIGGAQLGKSSFIDAFNNNKHQTFPIIREKTPLRSYFTGQAIRGQLSFKFIDTQGYEDTNVDQYIQGLTTFFQDKFEQYMKLKEKIFSSSNLIRSDIKIEDERPHCCLFFLRGPRICQNDWKIMKILQKYTIIIPVLAKGDSYTVQQIRQVKRVFKEQQRKRKIQWFNVEEFMRQKYPQKLHEILDGPYGQSPPFILAGCLQKIQDSKKQIKFGRHYKWGTCYLENPNHTDFLLLKNLLLYDISPYLRKYTQSYQNKYEKQLQNFAIEKQKKHSKQFLIKSLGVISLVAVVAFSAFLKRNQN